MTSDVAPVCGECGGVSCAAVFDELLALEFQHLAPYGRFHGLTVAAYGVQHPSRLGLDVREGQWSLLLTYVSEGFAGVERVQSARREANSHRRHDLPDVDPALEHPATLPDGLPQGALSICHLVGANSSFALTEHEQRVREWIVSIMIT